MTLKREQVMQGRAPEEFSISTDGKVFEPKTQAFGPPWSCSSIARNESVRALLHRSQRKF